MIDVGYRMVIIGRTEQEAEENCRPDLHSLLDIKAMKPISVRSATHVGSMEIMTNAYRILVIRP
jgi:hypothetical protein